MDDANLIFVVDYGNQPVVVPPNIKHRIVSYRVYWTKGLSKIQDIFESAAPDEAFPSLQSAFRIRMSGAEGLNLVCSCERHSIIYSILL